MQKFSTLLSWNFNTFLFCVCLSHVTGFCVVMCVFVCHPGRKAMSLDQIVFSAFQETVPVDTGEDHMEILCTDMQCTGTHAL